MDDDLGAPNCPSCLEPMEAVVAAWWCAACRVSLWLGTHWLDAAQVKGVSAAPKNGPKPLPW